MIPIWRCQVQNLRESMMLGKESGELFIMSNSAKYCCIFYIVQSDEYTVGVEYGYLCHRSKPHT